MAKIAYKKSLMDTNITILALQKKIKKIMDSVINVQIYKIDNEKLKYQYFPPSWEI
jgi:virulence-associated protein VapD